MLESVFSSEKPLLTKHGVTSRQTAIWTVSAAVRYVFCLWEYTDDTTSMQSRKIDIRSQWPRGPRRGSAASHLLGLRVRIPPWARISVCCDCCMLWRRGLCVGPIARLEESYRVRFVCVWYRNFHQWGGPRGLSNRDKKYWTVIVRKICLRRHTEEAPSVAYTAGGRCILTDWNCSSYVSLLNKFPSRWRHGRSKLTVKEKNGYSFEA